MKQRIYQVAFYAAIAVIIAVVLAGCSEGTEDMPLPRQVCTMVTSLYSCGRGSTCEQCGNWEIGCPKPLKLMQTSTGPYKGQPRLVCRLKEDDYNGVHEGLENGSSQPPQISP